MLNTSICLNFCGFLEVTIYMKTTVIVHHIDDLGRIVIPKEIRRNMHIREGTP